MTKMTVIEFNNKSCAVPLEDLSYTDVHAGDKLLVKTKSLEFIGKCVMDYFYTTDPEKTIKDIGYDLKDLGVTGVYAFSNRLWEDYRA